MSTTTERSTNTYSRGGGGVRFEHMLGAELLNYLLTHTGVTALGDSFTVTEVAFQTGAPIDDLRLRGVHPELPNRTLYVAAPRRPGLRRSDEKFVALVGSMLDQIAANEDGFDLGDARIGLALRADTPGHGAMAELCVLAHNASSGVALADEIETPGWASPRRADGWL